MKPDNLETVSGFRRRFRITPAEGKVCSEVEDDYHCMSVTLFHDGVTVTDIQAVMERAPWTTCPGAQQKIENTFNGQALQRFPERGEKMDNCTHLYDLALLAAQHAADDDVVVYDILVSDPIEGKRYAEIRSNGDSQLCWTEKDFHIVEPGELAGTRLDKLGAWIKTQVPKQQEVAKLLRWGNMIANGRSIPLEQQSDATRMPPNCYTFQPQRAVEAQRVGVIYDFSQGSHEPLAKRIADPSTDISQR
ncbi:DUF2889 domain-containing protein [Aestuariicella hydrocarbonica]|uniref:DUF2889 domain-containing protein n=1 Tax=Pseudomaricurvus hydrocarbonicus TaxID=1470433 RepID=A0A9E5JSH2_9GAMM|nr:DUF2889 domain-containing protein [Aestuariicella hydrocarbonica]NHO65958.1 DUF2889 domain-containing protein [Aestuariicella hydrocarbonica]